MNWLKTHEIAANFCIKNFVLKKVTFFSKNLKDKNKKWASECVNKCLKENQLHRRASAPRKS